MQECQHASSGGGSRLWSGDRLPIALSVALAKGSVVGYKDVAQSDTQAGGCVYIYIYIYIYLFMRRCIYVYVYSCMCIYI